MDLETSNLECGIKLSADFRTETVVGQSVHDTWMQ